MRALGLVVVAVSSLAVVACKGSNNTTDAHTAQCSDGVDNDGDGLTDFPDDRGCTSADDDSEDSLAMAECSDGRDNDGDGLIDYPLDPGCFVPQQDSEDDDCPSGPHCPACANGVDDDGDGMTDYPDDPGCTSAADPDEVVHNPQACGAGMTIRQLPNTGLVTETLDLTSTSMVSSPCGGGAGVPAIAYELYLPKPKVITVTTDDPSTLIDTIVDIRRADCMATESEVACSDDIALNTNKSSKVTAVLESGLYYIVVTSKTGVGGDFTVDVKQFAGEGTVCTMPGDCGPGLVCRVPLGGTDMVCSKPMCSDGVDDDGDGKADYPDDPGCVKADDNDETDNCPSGAGCPECGDHIDNDGDGHIDYPADTTCHSAADVSEACLSSEGVTALTMPTTTGDTTTSTNDVNPACGSSSGTAADNTYRLDVPALATLDLNLDASFDTIHALYNSTCGGTAIACSDPLTMHATNVAAGTYYLVVDGYFDGEVGPYTIHASGTIQNGQSCMSALAQSGALQCNTGYACKGPANAKTCQKALCSDGLDNDADGKIDYPNDPGCTSPADDTENDTCPGAGCPVCGDGLDNDTDGTHDWPGDFGCVSAAGSTEVFCMPETDPAVKITAPATNGTTASLHNDLIPSCRSTSTAPEQTLALVLPVPVATLVIDTIDGTGVTGHDTVLHVHDANCLAELACDDDGAPNNRSKITMTNVAAGSYAIAVDGYGTAAGPFTLNVHGTVAAQTACNSALFTAGVLACPTGTTCTANKCQ